MIRSPSMLGTCAAVALGVAGACAAPGPEPSRAPDAGPAADAGAGADAAPAGDAGAAGALRVVTFNLQNPLLAGEPEARTEIAAAALRDLDADFVCLQEAAETPSLENRAAVLAEALGYQHVWEAASGDPLFLEEGPAVLSRWPLTASEIAVLPHSEGSLGDRARRVAIGVVADTPAGSAALLCTHLTVDPREAIKADQARAAWQLLRDLPESDAAFFAGDLNAEPESAAMRFLRGEQEHEGERGDLVDAWMATRPDEPGYTHPAEAPEKRIDYVYAAPGAAPLECRRILDEPVAGLYASDHVGVFCELE